MVQHVVGMLLAVIELLEAETDRVRASARRLVVEGAVALIVATAVGGMLVVGSVFVLWACYAALRPALGEAWAALIVGFVVWIVLGGATWLVSGQLRRRRTPV